MFISRKEFDTRMQSMRDSNESAHKKIFESVSKLTQQVSKLEQSVKKVEKELGIFGKKEEMTSTTTMMGYSWLYPYICDFDDQTDPSLKERIYAIEKHLGGGVKEIESKKEIKFVPVKKTKKGKK